MVEVMLLTVYSFCILTNKKMYGTLILFLVKVVNCLYDTKYMVLGWNVVGCVGAHWAASASASHTR